MTILADTAALRATASVVLLALLLVWESATPFFAFFANAARPFAKRARHGLANVALGVLNAVVVRFVFLGMWVYTMEWANARDVGLLNWMDAPVWLRFVLTLLLLDVWMYCFHRLSHMVPFFWRFHRLHHTDRQMDVTTANRFHLGEVSLSAIFRVPILVAIGCRLEELTLYELLLFAIVQFHHANIALPDWLDRVLRAVVVTPHMHKVHHSVVRTEQNANFSSLFSWSDRAAGTLRIAPDLKRIEFGVED